jgi:hypothetical protein
MLSPNDQSLVPLGERSPSFTLGTALALLGHDCPGTCPQEATGHHAAVWFAHLPDTFEQDCVLTQVEVDFGGVPWSGLLARWYLRDINRCVQADRLYVRERSRSLDANSIHKATSS